MRRNVIALSIAWSLSDGWLSESSRQFRVDSSSVRSRRACARLEVYRPGLDEDVVTLKEGR